MKKMTNCQKNKLTHDQQKWKKCGSWHPMLLMHLKLSVTIIQFKKVYNPGPDSLELYRVLIYIWLALSKTELDIRYTNFVYISCFTRCQITQYLRS